MPTPDVFEVVEGPEQGMRVVLEGDVAHIGRDPAQNDVVLTDPRVSRRHARVAVEAGLLLIEDLGSRAGTLVNGERVDRPRPLRMGDRVLLGATELSVSWVPAPAATMIGAIPPELLEAAAAPPPSPPPPAPTIAGPIPPEVLAAAHEAYAAPGEPPAPDPFARSGGTPESKWPSEPGWPDPGPSTADLTPPPAAPDPVAGLDAAAPPPPVAWEPSAAPEPSPGWPPPPPPAGSQPDADWPPPPADRPPPAPASAPAPAPDWPPPPPGPPAPGPPPPPPGYTPPMGTPEEEQGWQAPARRPPKKGLFRRMLGG